MQHAKALLEGVPRVLLDQVEEGVLGPALRHDDFDAAVGQIQRRGALGQNLFEQFAILEIAAEREWRAADRRRPDRAA